MGPKTYLSWIFQIKHTLGCIVARKLEGEAAVCNKLLVITSRQRLPQHGASVHHFLEQFDTNRTGTLMTMLLTTLGLTEFEHKGHRYVRPKAIHTSFRNIDSVHMASRYTKCSSA